MHDYTLYGAHGSGQDTQAIHADSDTQGQTAEAQGDDAVMQPQREQEQPDEKDEMDEFTRWVPRPAVTTDRNELRDLDR